MNVEVRAATRADEDFLWEAVYWAIFVPDGVARPDRTVVQRPEIARYVRGWGERLGERPGERGWIAADERGAAVGAAWLRLFPAEEPGYGFVAADVPELTIALLPGHRGRGIGTRLLRAAQGAVPAISLSVDERNPAVRLYERLGFRVVAARDRSLTMVWRRSLCKVQDSSTISTDTIGV